MRVPTKLKITRTADKLSVSVDAASRVPTVVAIGANMVVGVESKTFVYPKGTPRPSEASVELTDAVDSDFTSIRNAKQGGIPVPGTAYVVEVALTVFETDIPTQHMWQPRSGRYRVLWQRTLQGVE